ncbi:MAG: ferritin-like domain-containing protein [Hyphomicrobiales bacterium]
MPLASLDDLFLTGLRDMYYAEKKLLTALPRMAKAAANEQLAEAFQNHRSETEGHVERLEQVFEIIEEKPRGKKCPAMDGLVAEGAEVMKEAKDQAVKDAGLIAAGQAVEHYEIARYGTLVAWAREMEEERAARLLEQTLEEEKKTDQLLNSLSEEVNGAANAEEDEEEEDED